MHRFYNPALSPEEIDALDWENWLTIQTVQGFLGAITHDVLAIAIDAKPFTVHVHIAVRRRSRRTIEAINDALDDLDALLAGDVRIKHTVVVGEPDARAWLDQRYRIVFRRCPAASSRWRLRR